MEEYCEKSMKDNYQWQCIYGSDRRDHQNPSFSSTLLDSIYRSIDEGNHYQQKQQQQQHVIFYRESILNQGAVLKDPNEKLAGDHRQTSHMIEKWMEKKGTEKISTRRSSAADIPRNFRNSSSSSSDSSSKGGFSSSESEYSTRCDNRSRSSSSCYSMKKLKPIRTDVGSRPEVPRKIDAADKFYGRGDYGGSAKTKSKALKIYGEIKKASGTSINSKQPISPGAKLASFLNSLFNAKKAKINSTGYDENFPKKTINTPKSTGYSSACSSASSFSRSCLSKTPSSRGKLGGTGTGDRRSVRFCPIVSEIVGRKNEVPTRDHEPKLRRSVAREEAENMLKNYQNKRENHDEEEDEDDAASCASSDLFELDHISGVGIVGCRYSEELPVYETTSVDTNRAIANGLVM